MPFTIDELGYDDVTWSSDYYITLIYYIDGNLNLMNYGLYNDKENTKNIEGIYSRAFELISIPDTRHTLNYYLLQNSSVTRSTIQLGNHVLSSKQTLIICYSTVDASSLRSILS